MDNQVIKQIHEKYMHTSDVAGYLRELGEAGVTLTQMARESGWSCQDLDLAARSIISPLWKQEG